MRIAGDQIGRRGAVALSVAGVAAAVLAIHGFANPGSLGLTGTGLGGSHSPGSSSPVSAPSSPGAQAPSPSPGASPSPASSPTTKPAASPTPGPLLSSTAYASYSYQLYPGSPSSNAKLALAGFSFSVHPNGSSVRFTLNVLGGSQAPITKTYPSSDHIYFVEANFGDDAQTAEYNFGDDGVVVTDATGHVVQ